MLSKLKLLASETLFSMDLGIEVEKATPYPFRVIANSSLQKRTLKKSMASVHWCILGSLLLYDKL